MLYPTRHFESVFDITYEFLAQNKIKALVLDIDNTLVTYGTPEPTEEVKQWINTLMSNGIGISIASNNNKERVERFCRGLDVFYTYKSAKPLGKCIRLAKKRFSLDSKSIALVGDQIFTDVLCARASGANAYLVTPLNSPESAFIRFKRMLEKPILSHYRKLHKEEFTAGDTNDN